MGRTCILISAIFLLIHCFMACSAMAAATQTNITTDQSALVALKSHITHDPHNVLAKSWIPTTSVCNWTGVTCGPFHRRVTALNLSYMGLHGTIPPHIGNLSFLSFLTLKNNSFNGFLPNQLSHLRRLKTIDLNFNNFTGQIPPSLFTISHLQILSMQNNQLSGTLPNTSISKLSSLRVFDLSNNQLSGSMPSTLFNSSSLQVINLGYNQLSASFPSTIFHMPSLQILVLNFNNLDGTLPDDMFNYFPQLSELYLSGNHFTGQMPSNLFQCRQLKVLSLSFNDFTGTVPPEIGNLTMLEKLYLGFNNFRGGIPETIGNLKSLELVGMQVNFLTGPVPSSIFNSSTLKTIHCTNNTLSGTLPDDICQHLPVLEYLYFSYNRLEGTIPSTWQCRELIQISLSNNKFTGNIPKSIGNLTMLKELYVGFNNLTGAIPEELGNLHNLQVISTPRNNLAGPIPSAIFNISTMKDIVFALNHFSGSLSSSIGLRLPNLARLLLGANELTGTIPNFSNASNLAYIQLAQNFFSGSIPHTFGNLRHLEVLSLENNRLTNEPSSTELRFLTSLSNCKQLKTLGFSYNALNGTLPISMGNLSATLLSFSASNCNIKGNIPKEIGSLSDLTVLNLENNELIGHIPVTIGRLQKLQRLFLRGNRLEGEIPDAVCHLKNLGELILTGNRLSGPLPTCLGNLTSLRTLHLDSNNLTSTLPLSLWSLTDILDVNFSSNALSGRLPMDIANWKVVSLIDLSRNLFSGDIPSTVGGLQNLVNLSLSHNMLQGQIPQSFGNLVSLEILDLSSNSLSGEIPKSLETLRYLKYLNVSSNKLQGEIPSIGPFRNFSAQSFMQNQALCGAPELQVPPCKTGTPGRSRRARKLIVRYVLPAILSAIFALAFVYVLLKHRQRNAKKAAEEEVMLPLAAWRRISHLELTRATDGFSESNLLGIGGVGSVYKGTLADGMIVAIKVFNLQVEGAFKSFEAECEVLRNIRHRNLIKIINGCVNLDFKALVLEYMPNGSLEKWLYSHNYCLDILQRLSIMIDVASALEYLHHGYSTPVVHCDLKPSNVLLHEDMVAHVADFGISKLLGEGASMAQTKTLATVGYMAPEYGSEGIISTKGDVYSYGILMMETFTRKKPTDEMFTEQMSLKLWIKMSVPEALIEVLDTNLLRKEEEHFAAKKECVSSIMKLALCCSVELPEERINMQDVLTQLNHIRTKFLKDVGGTS